MRLFALAALFASISTPALAGQIVLGDEQFYSKGRYVAWNGPWCRLYDPTFVAGVYNDTMGINDQTFPLGTLISWSMPSAAKRSAACPVYGYMALSIGNYDGGKPLISLPPMKAKDLSVLYVEHNFAIAGGADDFDVLQELYLTSVKGDASTKVVEIGWFLHSPISTVKYVRSGTQLGTYVSPTNGRSWIVAKSGTFITFMPKDTLDALTGPTNIKDALVWLKSKGAITGEEWFNGMAIGVEPLGNGGTMVVNNWKVSYR
jgi:hypothetical protein